MKNLYYLLLVFILFNPTFARAEGSKDLYPSGALGHRAFLMSRNPANPVTNWPYLTQGTHFVFGRQGETITAASSAQGIGNGLIILTAPDGTTYTSQVGSTIGRISDRTQELAGPNAPDGYIPFSQIVGAGQEGIWEVTFIPTRTVATFSTNGVGGTANGNWTYQHPESSGIAAWDVTVFDMGLNALSGRVYANVLNQYVGGGYYGKMYVLTNDGYVYRVDANGQYGVGFMSFVNNKGLTLGTGDNAPPSYKSLNNYGANVPTKDPREPDGIKSITHKMFYSIPDNTMPTTANIYGRTTWLNPSKVIPTVSNITIKGIEGTESQIGSKGGLLEFGANMAGNYKIFINVGPGFVQRTLVGSADQGTNTVFWDGKDGAGNPLPQGTANVTVNVQLQGAEVHFPVIDIEYNPYGLIIEQLNNDGTIKSDIVYWDDSDIVSSSAYPSDPTINGNDGPGISSNLNGHKWNGNYGDAKIMDTWTYILGDASSITKSIEVVKVDLAITGIEPTIPITNIAPDETVTYMVPVLNYGPGSAIGAPFIFKVPSGFTIENLSDVIYSMACPGAVVRDLALDANGNVTALLDIPNGCSIEFRITGKVGEALICQPIAIEASIMRPNDVTDIDATNPDPLVPPTDPHVECLNGTTTESCNNIKYNGAVTVIPAAPMAASQIIGCDGDTLTASATVPSGSTIIWYDAPSGGNLVSTPQLNTAGTVSYYAETNNGSCTSSLRTEVMLTINDLPQVVINNPLPICEPATIDLTAAEVTTGSEALLDFSYFSDPNATIPLPDPTAVTASGTYYIKASNPFGCTLISPLIVDIIGRPELLIGQPTCAGGNGSITVLDPLGPNYAYSIDGVNYQPSAVFSSVPPGTYNVTARNNDTNCESLEEVAIIEVSPSPPVPHIIQPDCSTSTGTITLPQYAGATYSTDGGTTFVANNIFTGLVPGTYSVMIMDNNSCISTPVPVTINPQPAFPTEPISDGDQSGCPGDILIASATIPLGNAISWYDAPSGGNLVTVPQLDTVGTITYYAQSNNGTCSSSLRTAVVLTIEDYPMVIVSNPLPVCEPATVDLTLTAVTLGSEPGLIFSYFNDVLASDPLADPGNVAISGTYYIRAENPVTGCARISPVTVDIMDRPELNIKQPTCASGLGNISVIDPLGANFEYSIDGINYQTAPAFTDIAPGTYQVTVRNTVTNCVSLGSQAVINISPAIPVPVIDQPNCGVATGSITLPNYVGASYSIDGGTTYASNNIITDLLPGIYSVVIKNSNNCTSTPIQAIIDPQPTSPSEPLSDGDQEGCSGDTLTATVTATVGDTVLWFDESIGGNLVSNPQLSTVGEITYYAETNNGICSSQERTAVTLRIYESPSGNAGTDQVQYDNGNFTLNATTNLGTGEWSILQGTTVVGISNILDQRATVTLDPNTSIVLRWTITNGTCAVFDDVTITYGSQADIVTEKTVNTPGQTVFTPGEEVEYSITVTNNGPSDASDVQISDIAPTGASITQWTATVITGNITLPNTNGNGDLNETLATLPNGATVRYHVSVQTPSDFIGDLTNTVQVTSTTEDPDPNCPDCSVTISNQKPTIALVKIAEFNDENRNGSADIGETISYTFIVTNTGSIALENISVQDELPGIKLYGMPISLMPGESDSTTFSAVYTITEQDIINGNVSNQASVSGQTLKGVVVSDDSDHTDTTGNNPTVVEIEGCMLQVHNALSPNNDGMNDVLTIKGIECYPDNTVQIFNRWGVLVFEVDGYNNGSNVFQGLSDGRTTIARKEALPSGTYFYILHIRGNDGANTTKKGYLNINR